MGELVPVRDKKVEYQMSDDPNFYATVEPSLVGKGKWDVVIFNRGSFGTFEDAENWLRELIDES